MGCENFWKAVSAIGTFGIGIGTVMLGCAGFNKLPEAAKNYSKAAEIKYNAEKLERQNKIYNVASKINRSVRKLATDSNSSPQDKEKALSEIKILEPEFKAMFRGTDSLDKLQKAYKSMDQALKAEPIEETKLKIDQSVEAINKLTEPIFKAVPLIQKNYPKDQKSSGMIQNNPESSLSN